MSNRKAKNPDNEIGELVAQKIAEQHQQLTEENWPKISALLKEDEEVKVSFGTVITNRAAEEGTVANKDSRIITTIAFSLGKFTAKKESPFPTPDQMDLGEQQPAVG